MLLQIDLTVTVGNDVSTGRISANQEGGILDDISLTANQSNKEVLCPFKVSDLTGGALAFFSDRALTIKTNSSGSPDDTFAVPAGGYCQVTALTEDITSIFVTNTDASNPANLKIRGARDVTP